MAVKPTPNNNLYKGLVFDGVDSRDYGIYITGEAVFNSPERDVEMIEIPGRNGTYALDKGRFSNIEVSYPAGIFGDTEADFRQGIRAFRNALASRKGYKRLEDDYNPDEYRMAVYKNGLEVTPTALKAGEFTITFDCQPQRWLKSGETAVSVASGGTLNNPTLFDAHPLLVVSGYGDITIGDTGTITISDDALIGDVVLANASSATISSNDYREETTYANREFSFGDTITVAPTTIKFVFDASAINETQSAPTVSGHAVDASLTVNSHRTQAVLTIAWGEETFSVGTNSTRNAVVSTTIETENGNANVSLMSEIAYNASTRTITRQFFKPTVTTDLTTRKYRANVSAGGITGYSTASAVGDDLYFDLDIGEAYSYEGQEKVSINNVVSFGAELPYLKPGDTTIKFDNTIDSVGLFPRWWEV